MKKIKNQIEEWSNKEENTAKVFFGIYAAGAATAMSIALAEARRSAK